MAQEIKYLDEENFKDGVAHGVVLVDFYADWCGPCRAIAPVLEQLAQEFGGKAIIAKIDVDKSPDITNSFNVSSIPTLILLKNGMEVTRFVGVTLKANLHEAISRAL